MRFVETTKGKKSLLEVTHDIYVVPKGKERFVHYTVEKIRFDNASGERLSHPELVKTGVKMFDTFVKRNLEMNGYTINILHHPLGKYIAYDPRVSNRVAVEQLEKANEEAHNALAEKEAKIAELEARIKAMEMKDATPTRDAGPHDPFNEASAPQPAAPKKPSVKKGGKK